MIGALLLAAAVAAPPAPGGDLPFGNVTFLKVYLVIYFCDTTKDL